MLLFKPEHKEPIRTGRKTQTRRKGKKRWNVGAEHLCYERPPFAKGGALPFAIVKILDVREEALGELSEADARREGYPNCVEYFDAYQRIYKVDDMDVEMTESVWVVDFEMVIWFEEAA